MSNYFSDRELGPRARTEQTMSRVVREPGAAYGDGVAAGSGNQVSAD